MDFEHYIDSLFRWGQYDWDSRSQYESDIRTLNKAFNTTRGIEQETYSLFRGEEFSKPRMAFHDGTKISDEIQHWCWSTDKSKAFRFYFKLDAGRLITSKVSREFVLFDVEPLAREIPCELRSRYPDLANLEKEVVISRDARIVCEVINQKGN